MHFNGNGNSCTVNLSITSGLPAGATYSFSPPSVSGVGGSDADSVLTINVPVGATNPSYTFAVQAAPSPGSCQNNGIATGNGTLAVAAPTCSPPSVTTNPTSQIVTYGAASVSFSAAASASPSPPTVQWQVNTGSGFTDIGGATNTTFTINNPSVALDGNQYRAVFTSTCNGTQTATSNAATLTVTPKALDITASNQSKNYGVTFTFTGTEFTTGAGQLVSGDSVTSVSLSSTGAPGTATVGGYPIVASAAVGTGLSNYNITYHDGTLTVNQATATVTADNKSKSYGQANPTLTATVTGTVNGDTLNYSLATTATQFSNVGGYPITVTLGANPNYNVTKTDGTLTINQANATVTADNQIKFYGQANATLTAVVTGQVAGGDPINYTLSTTATQFSNVGSYPITVNLGANPNYNVTANNGTLTINQAVATVTANDTSKTYGQANPAFTAMVTGEVVGGDAINYTLTTTAMQFSGVGPYPITVNLGSNPNYNVTANNGTLTINQAVATVTANDTSKTYGQANPAFTAMVTGEVVGGDAVNYTLTTTAMQFSGVGPYPITVNLGSNPNYNVTANNGTLTINQAVATVTADNKSKTYGQANPGLTATVVGQVVGGDAINYSLSTTATQFSNVGPYPITVTLGLNPNYSVSKTDGTLTINQAIATVTADNKSKTYGQVNPTLTATVIGQVVGGDTINYSLSTTATQFSNVVPGRDHGDSRLEPQLQCNQDRWHADDQPGDRYGDGG